MKKLGLMALFVLMFSGCNPPEEAQCGSTVKGQMTVKGQLIDVNFIREDSYTFSVILTFEDGRVQKARIRYDNPVVFHLNAYNIIEMDRTGKILSVEKTEGISD